MFARVGTGKAKENRTATPVAGDDVNTAEHCRTPSRPKLPHSPTPSVLRSSATPRHRDTATPPPATPKHRTAADRQDFLELTRIEYNTTPHHSAAQQNVTQHHLTWLTGTSRASERKPRRRSSVRSHHMQPFLFQLALIISFRSRHSALGRHRRGGQAICPPCRQPLYSFVAAFFFSFHRPRVPKLASLRCLTQATLQRSNPGSGPLPSPLPFP